VSYSDNVASERENFLSDMRVHRTELFDFHQPKTLGKTTAYAYLFKWIQKYFQQSGTNMIHPLYLQHEGQSSSLKRIVSDRMA
jgi:hypothetical protein